jgi:hypothetical protein
MDARPTPPLPRKVAPTAREFARNSGSMRPLAAARRALVLPTVALVAAALAACGRKEESTPDEQATTATKVKTKATTSMPSTADTSSNPPGTPRGIDEEPGMAGLATPRPSQVDPSPNGPAPIATTALAPPTVIPRPAGDVAPVRPVPTATAKPPATTPPPPPTIAPTPHPPAPKGKMPAVRPKPLGGSTGVPSDDDPPQTGGPAPCPGTSPETT